VTFGRTHGSAGSGRSQRHLLRCRRTARVAVSQRPGYQPLEGIQMLGGTTLRSCLVVTLRGRVLIAPGGCHRFKIPQERC
jgi:hypothetical protein